MNIDFVARSFPLDQRIRDFTAAKLEKLEKFWLRPVVETFPDQKPGQQQPPVRPVGSDGDGGAELGLGPARPRVIDPGLDVRRVFTHHPPKQGPRPLVLPPLGRRRTAPVDLVGGSLFHGIGRTLVAEEEEDPQLRD